MMAFSPTRLAWLLAAVAGLAAGCARSEAARERPVELIVSGDTAGWIVPCGCTSNQSGGLSRRASLVAADRRSAEVILVDAGGAASGTSPYDRLKFEAILRGEQAMGIAAHNVGAVEAALGQQALAELAAKTGVTFISTNLRDRSGRAIVELHRTIVAGGKRFLVLGVLAPKLAPNTVTALPPRDAILDALKSAGGDRDAVIVLAYLPEDELSQLANQLPEADAVIGGPTGQTIPPHHVGPTLLTSATNKGKFLVRAHPALGGRWPAEIVELDRSWPDDQAQQANLRRFRHELVERDFSAHETGFVRQVAASESFRLAGTETCRRCHADAAAIWDSSPHAQAWQRLEADNAYADAYCQQCHTTGYGQPGGFASARKSIAWRNVQCEACHGPSAEHAAQPSRPTGYSSTAADQCVRCHDHENSPNFEYARYWRKIAHGDKP